MDREQAEKTAWELLEIAKKLLTESCYLMPSVILFQHRRGGYEQRIIHVPYTDEAEKYEMLARVQRVIIALKSAVAAACHISEAWMAKAHRDDPLTIPPSKREDKEEVIIVAFKSHDFSFCILQPFDRQPGGVIAYGDPKLADMQINVFGSVFDGKGKGNAKSILHH